MMPNLQSQILAAIAAIVIGAVGSWWLTSNYYEARYNAAIAQQKTEAVKVLQEATDRAILAERKNNQLAQTLEVNHAQNRQKLDAALADNRRLARDLGGLRDPGRREDSSCSVPTGSTGSGIVIRQPSTGKLSAEATDFLLEFARDADRAAEYADLCYNWAQKLKQENNPAIQ